MSTPPFRYWDTPVEPGRTLIEASAGTGKTFAIAGLAVRLALDGDWLAERPGGPPDLRRLLVVTFTNAATEELRTRVRGALRAALRAFRGEPLAESDRALVGPFLEQGRDPEAAARRLEAALDRVDEAGIFTIHSFCERVLRQAAFESGTAFDLELVEDEKPLLRRAAADVWTALVHADGWLAALAIAEGWTIEALMEHVGRAGRFPGTRLLPEAPPLADALAALRAVAERLADVWDEAAIAERLAGLDWNANAPLAAPAPGVARVAAFARGEAPEALDAVRACAPAAVEKAATTRSRAQKERVAEVLAHPGFAACEAVVAATERLRLSLVHAFVADVQARFAEIKARRGALTFDDLLRRLRDALHDDATGETLAADLRRRYAVALIDEFQDTDPVQYAIFRTAFEGRPAFFIGDPKQAIYAFRGADVHAYLAAQAEADRRYTLATNWRTTARLVEAVNALFGQPSRALLYDGIPFQPVEAARAEPALNGVAGPPFVWWRLGPSGTGRLPSKEDARERALTGVVAEIGRLLRAGCTLGGRLLAPRDLAVLVPSNRLAEDVQARLRAVGVPSVVSKAGDIRAAREMAELERLLRAVAAPHDERLVRAALATELGGHTAAALVALDGDEARYAEVQRRLREAQRTWRRHGVLRAVTRLIEYDAAPARLLAFADGERRMTNLRHALELLHDVEQREGRSPEELLHWLATRAERSLGRDVQEMRLESDAEAVQITTLHTCKGLEYEVVFLPLLWDVHTKDYADDFQTEAPPLVHTDDGVVYFLDAAHPDHARYRAEREAERLAEFLRLAYVALTRARERCYVAWGAVSGGAHAALAYLLDGHAAPWADGLAGHVAAARAKAQDGLARFEETLAALCATCPDAMEVADLPAALPPPADAHDERRADGAACALTPGARERLLNPWRPASFSAWAAGRSASAEPGADEPLAAPRIEAAASGLHAFAAGRVAGRCLHDLLEHADFADPEGEASVERVRATLARYGLAEPRRHRAPIDPAAEAVALVARAARLPVGDATLADVPREARFAEWRFVLRLGRTSPAALADVFRRHDATAAYADLVARLSPDAADGYLTGIADLVFHHEGRWTVLDWKSNLLGPTAEAYRPEALARAMEEHHYVLQAHLYLVGLHRYLRSRLGAAYDPAEHLGGCRHVFLRGLAEDGLNGVWTTPVAPALLDALDAALADEPLHTPVRGGVHA